MALHMLLWRRRAFAGTAGEAIKYLDSFRNWERQGVPAGAGCDSSEGFDLVCTLPSAACPIPVANSDVGACPLGEGVCSSPDAIFMACPPYCGLPYLGC